MDRWQRFWRELHRALARDTCPEAKQLQKIQALCQDSDGNWLPPTIELPVGEFQAALRN